MKSEFLMLAQTWIPAKQHITGWFMSEKLDGIRAFWDGGISRGYTTAEIPWCNTVKDKRMEIATGLWSRTGKIIHAPGWWVDKLPELVLDGELCGLGFQELASIVNRHTPDARWENVKYKVFDSPPLEMVLRARTVKVRDYEFIIGDCGDWIDREVECAFAGWQFIEVTNWLQRKVPEFYHPQERLGWDHYTACNRINEFCEEILARGGEGVMLRKDNSYWVAQRAKTLLKHKPFKTAEGRVVDYTDGVGRLEGMMGALVLRLDNGREFKLSGFTDEQRQGAKILYPIGSMVEFKYRELSDDDIPKEARFMRRRYDC